jgi:hypothetical protein
MKILACLGVLLLFSAVTEAQVRFRIEEITDALTRETLLVAGDLMVCPVKGQGIACETLQFRWSQATPESITLRVEVTGQAVSISRLQMRVGDEVRSYSSETPTDVNYSSGLPGDLGLSSANAFVVPIIALKALAEGDPSLLRVCSVHDCVDLDFRRRAKFRGLPVDELNQLLAAISEKAKS